MMGKKNTVRQNLKIRPIPLFACPALNPGDAPEYSPIRTLFDNPLFLYMTAVYVKKLFCQNRQRQGQGRL